MGDGDGGASSFFVIYRVPIILVAISALLLVLAIVLLLKTIQQGGSIQFSSDTKTSSESAQVTIDVSGGVVQPGVYQLPLGSRVIDAITAAGGTTRDADASRIAATINQASMLSDGAKVYIPVIGKEAPQEAVVAGVVAPTTISINTASASELEALFGVGAATAKKIIDNRPYTSLEDIVTKKVFGQSLFDKLKNQLTL